MVSAAAELPDTEFRACRVGDNGPHEIVLFLDVGDRLVGGRKDSLSFHYVIAARVVSKGIHARDTSQHLCRKDVFLVKAMSDTRKQFIRGEFRGSKCIYKIQKSGLHSRQ